GRGDRAVPESGLHQVNRRAMIEGVTCVRVPQPMGGNSRGFVSHPSGLRRSPQNDPNPSSIKGFTRLRSEHWRVKLGTFSEFIQRIPQFLGHNDGSGAAAFSVDRDLARVTPSAEMPPAKRTSLRNA